MFRTLSEVTRVRPAPGEVPVFVFAQPQVLLSQKTLMYVWGPWPRFLQLRLSYSLSWRRSVANSAEVTVFDFTSCLALGCVPCFAAVCFYFWAFARITSTAGARVCVYVYMSICFFVAQVQLQKSSELVFLRQCINRHEVLQKSSEHGIRRSSGITVLLLLLPLPTATTTELLRFQFLLLLLLLLLPLTATITELRPIRESHYTKR